MSDDAYCLMLMRRALSRSDTELFGFRARYEARLAALAARLLSNRRPAGRK